MGKRVRNGCMCGGKAFPGGIGELGAFGREGSVLTVSLGISIPVRTCGRNTHGKRVKNACMDGGQAFPGGIGELDAFGREASLLTVSSHGKLERVYGRRACKHSRRHG